MSDERDLDMVEVVNRRVDILEALDAPKHKRDLVVELDTSRSTLDRAVRELDSLGLVTRDGGYRRTVTGRLVLDLFRDFLADLEDVAAARELLRPLPPDAPMSPAIFRGASVHPAEPPSPAQALDPLIDRFWNAERVRGMSVARTRPEIGDQMYELVTEEGVEIDVVYDSSLAEHFVETDDRYEEMDELDRFELSVHPQLPYGLGVVTGPDGETAFLALYDDDSSLRGIVLNDSREACRWADAVFERYREEADLQELS